jgi:hypothetical protein
MQEYETSCELDTIHRTQTIIYLYKSTICVVMRSKLAGNGLLYPTIKIYTSLRTLIAGSNKDQAWCSDENCFPSLVINDLGPA